MKGFFLNIMVTLCSVLQVQAQEVKTFSLDKAIAYAMQHSIDVKDALIDIADADKQVVEAKSIGIPQVNLSMDYRRFLKLPVTVLPEEFGVLPNGMPNPDFNPEVQFGVRNNFNTNFEINSLLFDGTYIVGLEAAKVYTNQVKLQLKRVKDNVRNKVREAYLPILIIEENIKILQKNLKTIAQLLFETQEMYKAGFVEQLDVDRLALSKANLLAELENLQDQKVRVLNVLKFQMGYPVDKQVQVEDSLKSLLSVPLKEDLEGPINFEQRSDFVVLASSVILNKLNIKRFKAGYLPQLVAFGSYSVIWQGDSVKEGNWSNNSVVGVQLNVPIFDGFNKRTKIQRARLQLEKIKNNKVKLTNAIVLEVKNAREGYVNAQKRLENRGENIVLAEKIYQTSQVKYKEGVGSSLEITQAEQGLFQAQSNFINAQYDLLVAKINLDKALGR